MNRDRLFVLNIEWIRSISKIKWSPNLGESAVESLCSKNSDSQHHHDGSTNLDEQNDASRVSACSWMFYK